MPSDNSKAIKELLEVIKNKVGKIVAVQGIQSLEVRSIKDQVSVLNEKLDDVQTDVTTIRTDVVALKTAVRELNKKADGILEFAQAADEEAEKTKRRLSRIEKIPAIAHELNKPS